MQQSVCLTDKIRFLLFAVNILRSLEALLSGTERESIGISKIV
jgi:hypothetical protein